MEESDLPPNFHLLATNFVPDPAAAVALRADMEWQTAAVGLLNVDISRLEERLSVLRTQRDSVLHAHDVNSALLAPVRKLPHETLGEIFQHIVNYDTTISPRNAPLLVMHVCRRWRLVAESTPRLWTCLNLKATLSLDPCHLILMWLSNYGSLPIDFVMKFRCWSSNYHEVTRLVVENLHRFHCFVGVIDMNLEKALAQHEHPIDAPLLESLDLYRNDVDDIPISLPNGSIRAPNLNSLCLSDLPTTSIVSFQPMSLRRLIMSCHEDEMDEFIAFLASCRNLIFLDICIKDRMEVSSNPRISFPYLETLSIAVTTVGDPRSFLNSFEASALRELALNFEFLEYWEAPSHLMVALDSFLGHNSPLQKLHLYYITWFDAPEFISLLRGLRNLCDLSLGCCAVDDAILRALTLDPSLSPTSWICPRLSTLSLFDSGFTQDCLATFVCSRMPTNADISMADGAYLRSVCVDVDLMYVDGNENSRFFAALAGEPYLYLETDDYW